MKIARLIFLFFLNILGCYSNDLDTPCVQWQNQIDQVLDLDNGVEYSKSMLTKVTPECRVRVYTGIAELFFRKLEMDSSMAYHEKAIQYAKEIKAYEALSDAYNSKISLLIRKEEHDEIKKLLKLSRKLLLAFPKSKSWIRYYEQNAYIAFVTSDYYRAIDYMDSTIIAAERSNYKVLIHETYDHLGYCYNKLGDYEKSAENFIRSLELREKSGYTKDLGGTYRNLGNAYIDLKYYDKAERFLKKAIALTRRQNHQLSLMANYHKLAQCYRFQGLNKEAEKALDSSTFFAKKNVDVTFTALLLREKGLLYFENYKNYPKSEEYFYEAYTSAKSIKDKGLLFKSIKSLIDLHLVKKEYSTIYKLITELEEINMDANSIKYKIDLLEIYARYYEVTHQNGKALIAFKKYHSLKDSITNNEIFAKVETLERQYDTKKKELKIVNLSKEKEKQQQIVEKAQIQQKLYLLAALFLLLIVVTGVLAYRKLRKQQKELSSINQVKNRLFSIIAHDLRGMILPFQRSGKILKHHIEKGNYNRTIELSKGLERNSEGLSNMLDNLLTWSLEQMDGYNLKPEVFSVKEELQEIISGYEQQATYKKTKIDLKFEKDLCISFNKGAFHIIFRNLIGNSLKYTDDGYILIQFKEENQELVCSVIDTGIGMTETQLISLFTLEEEKTTPGTLGERGTGLGLNLVDRFVKMHDGVIKVTSKKHIGTSFVISFPISISNRHIIDEVLKPIIT